MSPLKIGIIAALVVAGPPLWSMVRTGELDPAGAVGRGAVVAVAVTIGAGYVRRLIDRYEADHRKLQQAGRNLPPAAPPQPPADPPQG